MPAKVKLLRFKALAALDDRYPAAIAVGRFQTGAAVIAFYLGQNGDITLPPGVLMDDAAMRRLQHLAQTAEIERLAEPAARASWHQEGRA